jgi:hypothetical protein
MPKKNRPEAATSGAADTIANDAASKSAPRRPKRKATRGASTASSRATCGAVPVACRMGGATPPNDPEDDRIERGRQAWKSLKEAGRTTWENWLIVGEALKVGRSHAMERAKTDKPRGKRYAEEFHYWLQIHGFDAIDKSDRRKLLLCMEDPRIEKWREGLTEEQRASWNHPSTVWRVSRCKTRGINAVNEKVEAPIPNPNDLPPSVQEFDEENEELAWQRGLLDRVIKAIRAVTLNDRWLLPRTTRPRAARITG